MTTPSKNTDSIIPEGTTNVLKATLLGISCLALFTDALMTTSIIICLDAISQEFNQSTSIVPWIMTAYGLTFGSFLLLAGKISDIYHPKPVFICGFLLIGALGIGAGFVQNIIPLIILRALQGIGAAMTIPSATSMLTAAYLTPLARGIALTLFAAAGTLGLCTGFILGGVFIQFASWRWTLWVVPMISFPVSIISVCVLPGHRPRSTNSIKKLDVTGVVILTSSIILLLFALSQAPTMGWGTARVLVPLLVSLIGLVAFFLRQAKLDDDHALIPSKFWFIPNFLVLVMVSLCTQIYLTGPVFIFSIIWPYSYGWSPLSIGLHGLPMGVTAVIVCVILPKYILQVPPRISLTLSTAMSGLFSLLMVFGDSESRYWSHIFPSMVFITLGSTAAYMISNVGIVTSVPIDHVGVASAIFSAAQQVGGAINIAILTTIFVEVRNEHPLPSYKSTASALWYLVALGITQAIAVAVFLNTRQDSGSSFESSPDLATETKEPA